MNERSALLLCLDMIEEKLDWKNSGEWNDYDFKILKKEIFSVSGISISTHTLKRLFGKISYRSEYNPQHATKDALSMYIGYESWEDFLKNSKIELEPSDKEKLSARKQKRFYSGSVKAFSRRRLKGKKTLFFAALIIACLIAVTFLVIFKLNPRTKDVSFRIKNRSGIIPHTVTFEYDISKIRSNQIQIDFDFVHPQHGSEYILLDKNNKFLNHTYQVPGVFHPKLIINNRIVSTDYVVVKSKGWASFFNKPGEARYWIDNMLQNQDFEGQMTYSKQNIAKMGGDTTGIYYTTHMNIMDYGLSGDNFMFEVKSKNGRQNDGISCFDSRFIIFCEQMDNLVYMNEENCFQYCSLKFGENYYLGANTDLSYLSRDLSDWVVLRIEVVDKNARVFINNEQVYEESYTDSVGEIKGLQTHFKGSGLIDYILLTSIEGDTVFYDDFLK